MGRLPPGRRGLKRSWRAAAYWNICPSPSPRKAWIETHARRVRLTCPLRRLPPGRRGLKLPSAMRDSPALAGRLPPGRRGLKRPDCRTQTGDAGRLPPGRRGLKQRGGGDVADYGRSPSPRKAWIETCRCALRSHPSIGRLPPGRRGLKRRPQGAPQASHNRSPSPRKAWIETRLYDCNDYRLQSPSPRKAWIETPVAYATASTSPVAFPPEGVD